MTDSPHLATLPTPLEPLDRFAEAIDSPARLLVKRDDLTGLALGGNKARKLEHLCSEALARGCDGSDCSVDSAEWGDQGDSDESACLEAG